VISVRYPKPDFKICVLNEKQVIWDNIRKKYVKLTPEEWVRQNFLQYLIQHERYPATLMAVEKEIKLGELKKRCDIVIYKNSKPWMIIECKEPGTSVNEKTLRQILGYNMSLLVNYLILTNGDYTYGMKCSSSGGQFITSFPDYHETKQ
ncbi:MAG: type I restriction enzyme HsdR N-terminal domain-containing protein, partial [Chitinophagaceae bacterium]